MLNVECWMKNRVEIWRRFALFRIPNSAFLIPQLKHVFSPSALHPS